MLGALHNTAHDAHDDAMVAGWRVSAVAEPEVMAREPAAPTNRLSSISRQLSVRVIGSLAEDSDRQIRARSRSLPQRQQRQSSVLLPASHHLLLFRCPPPTGACGSSSLLFLAANNKTDTISWMKRAVAGFSIPLVIVTTSR